jgi:hemerythrin
MKNNDFAWSPGASLWTPKLDLGIPVIDEQHRQLIAKLEELLLAVQKKGEDAHIRGLALFLQRYSLDHFRTEEDYMFKFDYPKVDEHIICHNVFRGNIIKVKEFVQRHPTSVEALQLIESIMVKWYLEHIQAVDQEFASFLKEKGLVDELR